ncbi:UNVERIFIED_CONTAM: hypothetical protein Sindi_2147000 [Sesamum indicum]
MSSVASNFRNSPHFCRQSGGMCHLAAQVQQLQSLKLSLARVWAHLKVLLVGVIPVDLASVRLDHWDEGLIGTVFCPDLYDLAFDLDHHDFHREKVLLEFLDLSLRKDILRATESSCPSGTLYDWINIFLRGLHIFAKDITAATFVATPLWKKYLRNQ